MTERKKRHAYDGIYNRHIKRLLDIVISGAILLILWPLFIFISIAIVLEVGRPVFYRAERGGYKGIPFRICKFRSMVQGADRIGGGTTALNDSRITGIGHVLRKTKLDEIPQLVQVFLGKMSLVGPRPELLEYVNQYKGAERSILEVRPGITDYASLELINLDEIVGPQNADMVYETKILKLKNVLRVKYAETVSFRTDVIILIRTAVAVMDKIYAYTIKKEHR